MTSHRLTLILAGAFAVAAIAFAMILRHVDSVSTPMLIGMLLGTYGLGLGIGGVAFKRKG